MQGYSACLYGTNVTLVCMVWGFGNDYDAEENIIMKKPLKYYWKIKQKIVEKRAYHKYDGRLVLMFHEVSNEREQWYDPAYSISVDGFYHLITIIRQSGFLFVSPYDILHNDDRKRVCLTFDDAFQGVYDRVFPLLRREKIPFTVFPAASLLGKENYLNENMIREMMQYTGFYLGAHSVSHCILKSASDEQSEYELRHAKTILETLFEVPVDIMAYPYGSLREIGKREMKLAQKSYRYAFSTLQTCVTPDTDPYCIPRINVNEKNYKTILRETG